MTNYTIQFTKKDRLNDKIIIPYGTDLTNINKATFRQSIIDNATMNNPQVNLYHKITNSQKFSTTIKTSVGETVFPKTTHTLLTVYYTSYIKTDLSQFINKPLIYYYCTDETNTAIQIYVMNSGYPSPQIVIAINNSDCSNSLYKSYRISESEPKVVIDLTADLAAAREGKEIGSAHFRFNEFGGDPDEYYQHCINILNNVFISYTYNE
jgi:hypothetical protein